MKNFKLLVLLTILLVSGYAITGCGGGGGGGTTTGLTSDGNNPFAGEWSGNWITSSGQGGIVTLNITNTGVLSGTMYNTTYNQTAPMSGTVDNSGKFSSTYQYPNNPVGTFNGTLSTSSMANTIVCKYQGKIGTQTYEGSSALTNKNAGTVNNPYMGVWAGPFQLSNGQNGTINFSIDSKGTIAGSIYNATAQTNGTVNGNIDSTGNFYGTHQYPNNPTGTINGTISFTGINTAQCVFSNAVGTSVLSGNANLTKQ